MRRSGGVGWALGAVLVLGTAACSGHGPGGSAAAPGGSGAAPGGGAASPSATPGPVVTIAPGSGAARVRMDETVRITVDKGALTHVQVRSSGGKPLAGEFGTDKGEWHSTGTMAANTTYTVTAAASGDGTPPVTTTASFTTLKPKAVNPARLNIGDDQVVGVGMPVILTFDKPVKNRDAVLKALKFTTKPQVEGSWHWMEPSQYVARDTQLWFRPKEYWPAGTKATFSVDLGGVELSPGVWGKRAYSTRFTVGDAVVDTVDMGKHTLTMRRNGAVVRVIPITTGKPGPKWSTRNGIKVITDKRAQLKMESSTLGITDEKDPDFYSTVEYWTLRLTWSGEFLHARPGSEGDFGRRNVSHGCTGMSMADAKWLYEHSSVGDVVVYTGGDRKLESGNGYTAWNIPYEKWSAGA